MHILLQFAGLKPWGLQLFVLLYFVKINAKILLLGCGCDKIKNGVFCDER